MKRAIDQHLKKWKISQSRKPILLRGARQVGKTRTVQKLGASFESFVEINFEKDLEFLTLFEKNLDPQRIIQEIEHVKQITISPGKTLLFFDEIQNVPNGIIALRYFYEIMPELHVIAAGSLIDFAIQHVGLPVGRVLCLYMYPMSFIEFLSAIGMDYLSNTISKSLPHAPLNELSHAAALELLGTYLAVGGMPEAVAKWVATKDLYECSVIHKTLINTYRQDFDKYVQQNNIDHVKKIFNAIPLQLGKRFNYNFVESEYAKRELEPALELLTLSGVIHKVFKTSAQGIPLGGMADLKCFKGLFLDVALSQTVLNLDLGPWIHNPLEQFANKGELVEAFVGQELLAYSDPFFKEDLYYWENNDKNDQAEIDYVIQLQEVIVPIEVKSGKGNTLKSMHRFLQTHQKSKTGIRFSTQNYSVFEGIYSYPLYAVAQAVGYKYQL